MKRRLPAAHDPGFEHQFMMSITIKNVNCNDCDRNQSALLVALPTAEYRVIRAMEAWPGAGNLVIAEASRHPQASQRS